MENEGNADTQKKIEEFKEWAKNQAHFPKDITDSLLLKFIHSCYYDVEKAKVAAELFFSIRSSSPELFSNRDPLSPHIQKLFQIVNLAQYEIAGNKTIWIWQLNDPGLEQYDYLQDTRLFMLSTDATLLGVDKLMDGDIAVLDVKDISLKFITKFNVSIARKLSRYQEEAMPVRLKQVHIINAPPFIDKLYSLIKPFLKQAIKSMIHFHTPNSETLYEFISKDDLPADYGGKRDNMNEHMKRAVELIVNNREHFLHDHLWRVDKKGKDKTESSTEVGSFRSLAID